MVRALFIVAALAFARAGGAQGLYAGASVAIAELPLAFDSYVYVAGPSVEAGYRLTEHSSAGIQAFLLGTPGEALLTGITAEVRYFFFVPQMMFEPYAAAGAGIAQGDLGDVRVLALLVKFGAGGRQYLGSRNLYVAGELNVVNFIALGATFSFGIQF